MDRLNAAAAGEILDRIPVFCNLFEQGKNELGIASFQEYYSNGEYVAEAQLKLREKYGYDNVWNIFYVGREAEVLGCEKIIYAENGPPNVGEFIIQTYDDIHNLEIPDDLASHPKFEQCARCMNILAGEVGGKYPIVVYLSASTTLPAILMGMDKWLELLLTGPAEVRDELIYKCHLFFRKHIEFYINAGANCLVYSTPFASTQTMPMNLIDQLIFPWMEKDLAGYDRGGLVFYCGGAPFNNVIERVFDRLRLNAFYISPMSDLAEARDIINGRGITCGVIDDLKLLRWSKAEIRQEVKRIIDIGMPSGKFLFGSMVMPMSIPDDKIRTMLDAAFEYGTVPCTVG